MSEEKPWPVAQKRAAGHALELVDGRNDIEHGQPGNGVRMVERHAVADASTAIVADDRKPLEAERAHQLDEVACHLTLAEAFTVRAAGRCTRAAIPPQVGRDSGV